nr:hypothetical protein Iba_chr09fCG12490 [Ipomoea batatas]
MEGPLCSIASPQGTINWQNFCLEGVPERQSRMLGDSVYWKEPWRRVQSRMKNSLSCLLRVIEMGATAIVDLSRFFKAV